jgi:hypothetical protein
MAKTLFNLTHQLAVALGAIAEGTATGGSTTTLVDTVELTQDDDFWNGGTVWVTYDAAGAGAAPQGEYSVVTDFTASNDTATLRSTLTAAIASGDRYAIARTRFPLHILIQKVNEALVGVKIEKVDTSTITIASSQTEYSLPSDVLELREVWISTNDDTDDNRWERIYDFHVLKSATGTANKIAFGRGFSADTSVRLVYTAYHATLVLPSDKLDDTIHINRVVYNAAVGCLLWRKARVGESDSTVNELLNYFQNLSAQMNAEHEVDIPRKAAKTIHLTMDRP